MRRKSFCERGGIQKAEERAVQAICEFSNKYFQDGIDPFNGVMYCNFLYHLSRQAWIDHNRTVADKIYSLNKMLHGVDLFYEIALPPHWSCEHPLGTVMGRAEYGDHFFFYQGCTVGGSWHDGELHYPVLGSHVLMYSDSKILGRSRIGSNVTLAANAYIINEDIPDDCIVFGQSPSLTVRKKR